MRTLQPYLPLCRRAAAAAAFSALMIAARAAPFTPGNAIVYRVGTGAATVTNAATAVFLDEYMPTGALVQSIPITAIGASALTAQGTATSEGIMTRTQNGARIVFTGYRKDAGGTAPSSDTPAVTPRVVATVDVSGNVDTSIGVSDPTGTIRSATSVDGTSAFYIGTSTSVRYIAAPGPASTTVSIDNRNSRQVYLTGNTLIASNGTTILPKVQSYGALPTAATTASPLISMASGDSINSIWLADLSPTVAGDDTLYMASQIENLVRKFTWDGTVWTATGSISLTNVANICGALETTGVRLYAVAGSLFTFVDTTGYGGTLAGSFGTAIATAATNTAMRGVNTFPQPTATPATFSHAEFLPSGDVRLTWLGTAGTAPVIHVSPDLVTWQLLGTATESTPGVFLITDTPPTGATRRFYKTVP